jgi:hypothetical protein
MPRAVFEPVTAATKRPQTHSLDHAATGYFTIYITNVYNLCTYNMMQMHEFRIRKYTRLCLLRFVIRANMLKP